MHNNLWSCQNRTLLIIVTFLLMQGMFSGTILYLQEDQLDSTSATLPSQKMTISTLCSTCTNKTQYGISLWIYQLSGALSQSFVFRVANDPGIDLYEGRILMSLTVYSDVLFNIATSSDDYGHWDGWNIAGQTANILQNHWTFVSAFVDQTTNIQYGMRYYVDQSSYTTYPTFQQRNDGSSYQMSPSAVASWGGKDSFNSCDCYLQYVRVYLDWKADSQDKMIDLALMNPNGKLYRLYFTSDPLTNNNQTFIVDNMTNVSEAMTLGFKGYSILSASQDPSFGPYNILMCRSGQIASFPINSSISQDGLVVAFDFYPYSGGLATQTVFSIRDTATNFISLRLDYLLSSGTLNIWRSSVIGSPEYLLNATITSMISITSGSWNRIIVEIVQTQPLSFGFGFSSARVWVNQISTPRVYFGNFTTGDSTIADGNSAALEICGLYDSTSSGNVNPTLTGYFDILNFVWFQGAQGLFQNTTASDSCVIEGTLQLNQTSCLKCASGYFLQDSLQCVSIAPNNSYFLHIPTNSYERCFYGQYYNISNGDCLPCTSDGQLIQEPQCVNCDSTCRKCTGVNSDQCTSCYSETYLYLNECVQNCPSIGYYPNTTDLKCYGCSLTCLTCSGPATNNCTSCIDGLYLDNFTCVSVCSHNGFTNNQTMTCDDDDGTCLQTSCFSFNDQCQQIDNQTIQKISQMSSSVRTALPIIGLGLVSSQAVLGATSSSLASSMSSIHLMLLLKYIYAGYPPNVEAFFKISTRNAVSKDSSPVPEPFLFLHVANITQYQSTWYRFAEYAATVNFLANCGTSVMICIFSLVMILILEIIKKYKQRKSTLFYNILYRFEWNMILSCIASNQSKFVLGWLLQFSGPIFDTYGTINLVVAVLSLLAILFLSIVSILHARWNGIAIQNNNAQNQDISKSKQKKFAFLTEDYKTEDLFARYFFMVSFVKIILVVSIIFCFPLAPIVQALFLMFLNIFYILLLIVGKPYKDVYHLVAILCNEIILLIQEILVFLFVINKQFNFLSLSQGTTIGWIFIGLIFLCFGVSTFFGIFITVRTLILSYRNRKASKTNSSRQTKRIEHREDITHEQHREERLHREHQEPEEPRDYEERRRHKTIKIPNNEQQDSRHLVTSRTLKHKKSRKRPRINRDVSLNDSNLKSEKSFLD